MKATYTKLGHTASSGLICSDMVYYIELERNINLGSVGVLGFNTYHLKLSLECCVWHCSCVIDIVKYVAGAGNSKSCRVKSICELFNKKELYNYKKIHASNCTVLL